MISSLAARRGTLTQKDLLKLAEGYQNLALECVMTVVRVEADQKQQEEGQEEEASEQPKHVAGMVMA
jgi:hypothetical protein